MQLSLEGRSCLLLIYILFLHASAILFFTRGFLLTRTELSDISSCSDALQIPCPRSSFHPESNGDNVTANCVVESGRGTSIREELPTRVCSSVKINVSSGHTCWTKASVKRVVIIIIDALRLDFIINDHGNVSWRNKLNILQEEVKKKTSPARIFKFISDPPTTTLQRLKGLTTGGLPTFIDVGNSFGAPAIVEDNLILQLARNDRRVLMMGDDTWLQLFPSHFSEAYPFPSFNVKDLHTVDDGVIREIFPALDRDDWDVLIAHFLGVDHVGHIFNVESPHMVDKLEQYDRVLKDIIGVLREKSHPGGLHEDTLLIVMGDHGQTMHGDHGGGTPEEVETGLFAMTLRTGSLPLLEHNFSQCEMFLDNGKVDCVGTFPQLDFAATLAALLGIPFPFGSVGHVNPDLFALATWEQPKSPEEYEESYLKWMEWYSNVLCMNSWQVKRYLDKYTSTAISGFPKADILHLNHLFDKSQNSGRDIAQISSDDINLSTLDLRRQITGHLDFLNAAASLARSKWTQFGDVEMAIGLALLFLSVIIHVIALRRIFNLHGAQLESQGRQLDQLFPANRLSFIAAMFCPVLGGMFLPLLNITSLGQNIILSAIIFLSFGSGFLYIFLSNSSEVRYMKKNCNKKENVIGYKLQKGIAVDARATAAIIFVALHAVSLLSNSFILEEGRVASFLLATMGLLYLRCSLQHGSKIPQALLFLILNRALTGMGLDGHLKDSDSWMYSLTDENAILSRLISSFIEVLLPLSLFTWLAIRYFRTSKFGSQRLGLMLSYAVPLVYCLIVFHWFAIDMSTLQLVILPGSMANFIRLTLPQSVYLITIVYTALIVGISKLKLKDTMIWHGYVIEDVGIALLAGWSGFILLLLGRKGPLLGLVVIMNVWCMFELQTINPKDIGNGFYASIVDWNLLSILLFFCTNHRCTFDGLRYPVAFIGFDEFNIYRQGALLALDTFGASHVLPVVALPLLLLARIRMHNLKDVPKRESLTLEMMMAFLSFGMVRAVTTMFSTICVAIQRRHLMVWGLFAPKYVFDAIGLLVTDFLLVFAASLFFHFGVSYHEDKSLMSKRKYS